MRKLFVMLALVIAAACCAGALAATGDAVLCREDDNRVYFNYGFGDGATYYMVSYDGLYTYHVGDADVENLAYALPEDMENTVNYDYFPFAADGKLYAVRLTTDYSGAATAFVGAELGTLNPADEGELKFEKLFDVDWEDMLQYYDNDVYPTRPEGIVTTGGSMFFRYFDEQGECRVKGFELETGKAIDFDVLNDLSGMCAYKEGMLLLAQTIYGDTSETLLSAYDTRDGSTQLLCSLELPDYSYPAGLAYDKETDILYCVMGGEIRPIDLQNGTVGEGVADMPIELYSNSSASILEGGYYASCSDGAAVRNLDPTQRAETRLKISDTTWSESVNNAYYRFSNSHGDISVVLSRDYAEADKLVESMMNRDDSVDVYVLDTATAVYDALFSRGYMMELDGSAGVSELAEHMYPALREGLSVNGHIVALPVEVHSFTVGVNTKALEALGLTMDDVPDNWSDLLDFLNTLGDKLPEDGKVTVFYQGETVEDARIDLFYRIFEDYQKYINHTDPEIGYNTELLRGLLDKLEHVDFESLGCIPMEDFDENGDYYSEENLSLLDLSTGCTIGNFYGDYMPVLMSMDANTPHLLSLDTQAAFVNPYTRSPEAALAFMDELAGCLSSNVRYCLDPEQNEPIRGKWNEEYLAELEETLAAMRESLESAPESDRQMIEANIHDYEESLEYAQAYSWEISQRELDWYRGHDDALAISTVNWLYADGTGEGYELMSQYTDGMISAQEMLEGIDKKVRMMMMEGN